MPKGFILLTAVTAATLGSVAVATPASAQYHHGHDRGYHRSWNGGYGYHDRRRAHWRHDRQRRWHNHDRHYRGYYGNHHRGW